MVPVEEGGEGGDEHWWVRMQGWWNGDEYDRSFHDMNGGFLATFGVPNGYIDYLENEGLHAFADVLEVQFLSWRVSFFVNLFF